MRTKLMIVPLVLAAGFSFSALAGGPPPAKSLPLSDIVAAVEEQFSPVYIDEVSWDSDGYWEVEYIDQAGSEREVKIDPLTGNTRSR